MIVSRRIAVALGGVAAAAVVGTAGVAAAAGSSGSTPQRAQLAAVGSPAPSASPSAGAGTKHRKAKHARLGRGLHGEFVAKGKDGKLVTVVTVRGTVTAVSPTSVTFKAEDGYTATFVVGGETKVRGKEVDAIADVKVGDTGAAAGVKSTNGITARAVAIRKK